MNAQQNTAFRTRFSIAIIAFALVALSLTSGLWLPLVASTADSVVSAFRGGSPVPEASRSLNASHDDHEHGHEHAGHDESSALELTDQALRNIGLSRDMIRPVRLETFRKSITVPARVVERPGRTRVQVATPMTGVVTHVHAVQGEAVKPGTLLFQLRLTHEDLVNAQTEFVKTLGELEVENREIARLRGVTQSGAVAGKLLLDREYSRDKLNALLEAQREALRLHGLSDEQVSQIETQRRLLRDLQIFAPSIDSHLEHELKLTGRFVSLRPHFSGNAAAAQSPPPLVMQELVVHKGQSVNAGETLCVLTDYSELYIEGLAFEQDISQLRHASDMEWTLDAIFQRPGDHSEVVPNLQIAYLANQIDPESRTLPFYVGLPNEIAKDRSETDSRYVEWKYLPGQRLQLRIPVEEWSQQIVLPVDAVARDGAESFVFQQNGNHFDRVPVHVKYRDQYSVVIEHDGSLFPGDVVALRGAHQMQMALQNKAGGGVDPHAGHNH